MAGVEVMLILVPLITLGYGVEVSLISLWTGVVPSTTVLLIHCRFMFVPVLFKAVYVTISCTAGNLSVCGTSTIMPILRFFGGGKTETSLCWIPIIRLLNKFWWLIPLLVWVIPSRLLANSTCMSLAVAAFNSYPKLFIVMLSNLVTALTSLFGFSSFSLADIVFEFSLCGLKVRLNISEVKLLLSVIAYYCSYIMTCNISSLIFTLDNGIFLWSF